VIGDFVFINLLLPCGEVEESEKSVWGRDGEDERYIDHQFLWDVTL
jgi:hypothetical protein